MSSLPSQLSALARHALRWQYPHSLHTSAVTQTSAQPICSLLLQDAAPHTSSDAQLRDFADNTADSSSHVRHGRHHQHNVQLQPIHNCNQVSPPSSVTPASVTCSSANIAACLVNTLIQHRQSPHSTHWSRQSPSHSQSILSWLHATPQHIRHISTTVTCWRPPQSNQDAPNARGSVPRPMYQTPSLQSRHGFASPGQEPKRSPSQAPYSERQRPPFQRSSPPHARQPGES